MNPSNTHELITAQNTLNNALAKALVDRDQEIAALREIQASLLSKLHTQVYNVDTLRTEVSLLRAQLASIPSVPHPSLSSHQSHRSLPSLSEDEAIQPDAPEDEPVFANQLATA